MVEAITGLLVLGRVSKAVELYNSIHVQLKAEDRLSVLRFTLKASQQALFLDIPGHTRSKQRRIPANAVPLVELLQATGMAKDLRGVEVLEVGLPHSKFEVFMLTPTSFSVSYFCT